VQVTKRIIGFTANFGGINILGKDRSWQVDFILKRVSPLEI
jgi:hypothetical protein